MTNSILQSVLNLFLKPECPICARPTDQEFCRYCEQQLLECQFTHGGMFPGEVPIFVWGRYGGVLKQAIAALKYDGNPQIAKMLGYCLAEGWLDTVKRVPQNLVVVPIPLHPAKLKQRGFNQAELLGRGFCEITGLSMKPHGLQRLKNTEALHGLSRPERYQNLQGALRVGKDPLPPRSSVLIIDDIYTTGATVNAAIQAFKLRKIKVAGVVALATTASPKSSPRSLSSMG
ncbi:MAG: ComF family protein [Limnospira sp. PMC 1291.21]|uniref:Phosphoribosyltransferase n=3 Tax=Limnospira TaxID=2596745 RepID=A0A9P1KGD9_9CYAN|nr:MULTISPECIES: ComF family protein [Limnospira]EKD06449.1 hypothetical protein SPLC1_S530400 [Arthrospira platensis C1]MDC0837217.1 ComF family protein [Limnoraphis robusta]MDY7055621.1 ComF family protein [Limnospira fusiformis LS22]QJB26406.1 ComF family protein [Limnospira fusiformis SAG 85.79]RAQ47782.1 ComF family protein [Arthrospira sp. O9.13F]